MILFLDTETSGLSRFQDHIVQVAWILCDVDKRVLSKKCHVVKPVGFSIPEQAARIHGITTAIAAKVGIPLAQVLMELAEDAASAHSVVAHNVEFDLGILEHDFDCAVLTFPFVSHIRICTMKASTEWCCLPKRDGRPGFKYPKLEELHYKLFKCGFDNAHDAMADTIACMNCYFELVRLGVMSDQRPLRIHRREHVSQQEQRILQNERDEKGHRLETERVNKKRAEVAERSIVEKEQAIRQRYDSELTSLANSGEFRLWWIGCAAAVWLLIETLGTRTGGVSQFILSSVFGAVVAFFARGWYDDEKMKSPEYLTCIDQRDQEIAAVRNSLVKTAPVQSEAVAEERKFHQSVVVNTPRVEHKISPEQRNEITAFVAERNRLTVETLVQSTGQDAQPIELPHRSAPNATFMKALTPSAALAAVVGAKPLPRTEVVKQLWVYIKQNNLQDAEDKRKINADAKLKEVFGKDQVSMFEMSGLIGKHLH